MSNASKTKGTHAAEPEADGADRRRSTREPVITQGMIRAIEGNELEVMFDKPQQVLVTNVSLHGVGFRSTKELDVEVIYAIEIGVGPLHLSSRMKLRRVKQLPDGSWDCGGEFI